MRPGFIKRLPPFLLLWSIRPSSIYPVLALAGLWWFAGQASAAPPAGLPSLAVLVHAEPGGEALTQPLRSLLEVETAKRYEGPLLERAELATVLQELKLSSLSGGAVGGAPQLGKFEGAACLVLARVGPKSVQVTINSFPKTEVIFEKRYSERLEPESLAERIAGDVLNAVRTQSRDTAMPYLAIGSFFVLDPHRRFLEFSRTAEVELRRQMGAVPDVRLVERLFPSDLLNEFNLVRAGMTVSKATDFNAPPADLLIYGECTPQAEQELNNPGILLDCTLKVISPTNLFPERSITVVCRSNETGPLIEKAQALLLESLAAARAKLAKPNARGFSTQEFESFKKQAFRLMPAPPLEEGVFHRQYDYRGPRQTAPTEVLERALRMLECATLFSGNDTTILDCTAAVLKGLADQQSQPVAVRNSLSAAAMELAERAYRIESNWNTRAFYAGYGLADPRPEVMLSVARYVWNTRDKEPWVANAVVDDAFRKLMAAEPDWDKRLQFLLDAAPIYEKRGSGLRALMDAVHPMIFYTGGPLPAGVAEKQAKFAGSLMANASPFLRTVGHLMSVVLAVKNYEAQPDARYAADFVQHYRACLDMIPKLYELHGGDFSSSTFAHSLWHYLRHYHPMLTDHGLQDDVNNLREQYVVVHMRTGNYNQSNIDDVLRVLVPSLQARHQEARAAELLKEFLTQYHVTGSADYTRMEFTRILNACLLAGKRGMLHLDQLSPVPFEDGGTGWVKRLVPSKHGVFGVRTGAYYQGEGRAFRLGPGKATLLKQVTASPVYDLACTDNFIAAGTREGVFLLDPATLAARQLTVKNSSLPDDIVSLVGDSGADFLIGAYDRSSYQTLIYRLEPDAGRIAATDVKLSPHTYWRIKAGQGATPVLAQTWNQRNTVMDGKQLTLSVSANVDAIKDVSVTQADGEVIFSYHGFELSYVYDFLTWQNHLVFVTGNGLYISKPGTNELRCILSEPDLLLLSGCAADDRMVLGTNKGLYILNAAQFTGAIDGR